MRRLVVRFLVPVLLAVVVMPLARSPSARAAASAGGAGAPLGACRGRRAVERLVGGSRSSALRAAATAAAHGGSYGGSAAARTGTYGGGGSTKAAARVMGVPAACSLASRSSSSLGNVLGKKKNVGNITYAPPMNNNDTFSLGALAIAFDSAARAQVQGGSTGSRAHPDAGLARALNAAAAQMAAQCLGASSTPRT